MTDTQALIERLEALGREATPGPWEAGDECISGTVAVWDGDHMVAQAGGRHISADQSRIDARLIASLRNALPEIIAALREREGEAKPNLNSYIAGYEDAQERTAVVAWLRMASEAARQHHREVCYTEDDDVLDAIVERMNNYAFAADQIEAGIHLRSATTPPTGSAAAPDGDER